MPVIHVIPFFGGGGGRRSGVKVVVQTGESSPLQCARNRARALQATRHVVWSGSQKMSNEKEVLMISLMEKSRVDLRKYKFNYLALAISYTI